MKKYRITITNATPNNGLPNIKTFYTDSFLECYDNRLAYRHNNNWGHPLSYENKFEFEAFSEIDNKYYMMDDPLEYIDKFKIQFAMRNYEQFKNFLHTDCYF